MPWSGWKRCGSVAPKASSPACAVAEVEPDQRLGAQLRRLGAVEVGRGGGELAQRHPPRPEAAALGDVGVGAARGQRHDDVAERALRAERARRPAPRARGGSPRRRGSARPRGSAPAGSRRSRPARAARGRRGAPGWCRRRSRRPRPAPRGGCPRAGRAAPRAGRPARRAGRRRCARARCGRPASSARISSWSSRISAGSLRICSRRSRGRGRRLGHAGRVPLPQTIFCPVADQSLRKAVSPLSVSGCSASLRSTAGRRGDDVGADQRRLLDVVDGADRGREDLGLEAVVVVDRAGSRGSAPCRRC